MIDEKQFDVNQIIGRFSEIKNRLNLQSIGHYILENDNLLTVEQSNFEERQQNAEKNLERELHNRFEDETVEKLLAIIEEYSSINDDIYFSLGMKVGAKILLLLTNNFETDI